MSVILETTQLTKHYQSGEGTVAALQDVSLAVESGQFVAIMGASGSGKSTLLHLMAGLDTPTHGSVVIEGRRITDMSDRDRTLFRRRRLGFVFQGFNLLPTLTARENIALPLLVDGVNRRSIDPKIDELLDIVGLSHRASHRPQAMSGGEQQRVAIARALVNDAAIVMADEPTGNLDSRHADEIWRVLRDLVHLHQRTVIVVTHESAGAAFANRVAVLKDGRLVGEIEPKESQDATLVATRYAELAG